MGWGPSLGLVGGRESRMAVAIGWLGFDTNYGEDDSLVGLIDEHI